MAKQIDHLAGLLEQLSAMDSPLPETLAVGILVASIEVNDLMPVTASIKTMADQYVTCEDVSSCFDRRRDDAAVRNGKYRTRFRSSRVERKIWENLAFDAQVLPQPALR